MLQRPVRRLRVGHLALVLDGGRDLASLAVAGGPRGPHLPTRSWVTLLSVTPIRSGLANESRRPVGTRDARLSR